MRAGDLVSDEIPTLQGSDNALFAMQLLDEYKMTHLPVVDGKEFLGLISDSTVLEIENPEAELRECKKLLQVAFVKSDQHAYELIKVAAQFQLSAIPVLDENHNYEGVVSIYCLVRELSNIAAMREPGAIIVLEMNESDYSLSEIAQIVEGNNARILSANVTSTPDSRKIEVTLKINQENIDGVIQTFNRYEYQISASYHQSTYDEMLQNRYDELMRYLKI
ncbi:MAG TPA: CBS domain-containing protein [Cryomorphaceae bacterium]|nr:CBS domain-containing protein [Cryomorphaceae bacterium]